MLSSVLLTHVHPDHIGGVDALSSHFGRIRVAAHSLTAEALQENIQVDTRLDDEDVLQLEGEPLIALRVLQYTWTCTRPYLLARTTNRHFDFRRQHCGGLVRS